MALLLVSHYKLMNLVVHRIIKIFSYIIILLGIAHISFAFPLHKNTDTLWFVGAGMAIIFSGLLNLIAIDRGGSKFTKWIAVLTNAINCAMFWFALPILKEPQVYAGITIFLITTTAFVIELSRHKSVKQ
jgi:hypothetical protein